MGKLPWFPKYILGPALAAALGYWIVGPRLAGSKKFQSLVKEKASQMAASTQPAAEEKPTEGTSVSASPIGPEPEVTVGVKPVEEEPRPHRRRRHRASSDDPEP
jgi:hypothetical protein